MLKATCTGAGNSDSSSPSQGRTQNFGLEGVTYRPIFWQSFSHRPVISHLAHQ